MSKLNWRSMIAVLSDLTEDELKQALDVELARRTSGQPSPGGCISGTLRCGRRGNV
jgi:hypothetical protein